jgi:hypothetical protein
MSNEKQAIQTFINSLVSKDYSQARTNLESAVAEKLKSRIRSSISNEQVKK